MCKCGASDVEIHSWIKTDWLAERHDCAACGAMVLLRDRRNSWGTGWIVRYEQGDGDKNVAEVAQRIATDEIDPSDAMEAGKIMTALDTDNPYLALIRLDKFYTQAEKEKAGLEAANKIIVGQCDQTEGILKFYRAQAGEIAANLAHLGELPHKEKNEGILRAVARLIDLAMANNLDRETGEIPF